jgi:seryl-tRNA synthetase
MIDLKYIQQNPTHFNATMIARNAEIRAEPIIELDNIVKANKIKLESLQAERNLIAKNIASYKHKLALDPASSNKINEEIALLTAKSQQINTEIANSETNSSAEEQLKQILATVPNLLDRAVPIAADENGNIVVETFGDIPKFDFTPQDHSSIATKLGLLDFEQSAIVSGARFSSLFGNLAKLERALSNFMLDIANENGYNEVSPPNLVKSEAMFSSGQLPKFAEEAFRTVDDYWLIPTAEVSLVNLFAKIILQEEELPIRLVAYTPCFRREAGSAGRDTKGMIRQHQFKKVELISLTTAEQSKIEHERMTAIACSILQKLELPYRKIMLCSGDISFTANKTYDLEVWLPSQNQYREISSCSNCGDFQARRLMTRYKDANGKNQLVHTLNGSALAVGRTIVAIIENYQQADGSVVIPNALRGYIGGLEKL